MLCMYACMHMNVTSFIALLFLHNAGVPVFLLLRHRLRRLSPGRRPRPAVVQPAAAVHISA